jgi:REP element-mobilizing transposase RayT
MRCLDHAHLLCRLSPTLKIADFIGQLKGATSFRINKEIHPRFKLHWQEGYGVISLRRDEIEKVARYIDRQEEHHGRGKLSAVLETMETNNDDWLRL